jgi:predicted O-methyltransferase YrrM
MIDHINQHLTILEEDKASAIKPNEAEFIYHFIKEKNIKRTLEVGFAFARSASHIIAATGSKHIVMDPFQENYGSLGLKNIENMGFADLLEYRNDFSHNVLPALHREKQQFEFVFIDGDHKYDGIFVDFYYSDLLLEEGGYLLFHDTWMRSTQLVLSFIKKNRKDYRFIPTPLRNITLVQKVGKDQRNGMHFREFYNLKRIFVHNIIMWLTTGENNALKKLVFYMKEKIK